MKAFHRMSPFAVIVLAGFVLGSQAGPPPQPKTAAPPAQTSRPIAAVQTPGATPGWQTIKPGITSSEQDNGIDQPSGAIYSTGAEDVVIKILDPMRARRPIIIPRLPPMPASPFISGIYLFSPGPERLLGGSQEIGKVVSLGKLPPGQLVFGVKTGDGYTLFANDPAKNPDRLDHGITRTFKSGIREIWFEDAPGPLHTDRSDRDFDDARIEISGGIDSGAVAGLVMVIKEQKGEAHDAAVTALKKINPKAALAAGLR